MGNFLPQTIRIGGLDYTVIEVNDLRDGNTGLNGWIRYNPCKIFVEEDMVPQVQFVTVWHEVIHGILSNAGIDDHDEKQVLALGYGIVQVLRDNPWLRNFQEIK